MPFPALPLGAVLAVNVLDAHSLINAFGTIGIMVILIAETGLLVGLFLPGDTLLFTAGLLCASGHLSLAGVLLAAAAGAIVGAQIGYALGRSAGPRFFERDDRPRLRAGVDRAQEVLDRYGYGKAIVIARFMPVVRTLLNPLAGVVRVPPRTFLLWNVVGGLLWAVGVTLAGYALGSSVPHIDRYLLPIVAVIFLLSILPVALEIRRARSR